MALKPEQLHFLLVPLMSQSHIIPLSHFAESLARKGAFVSIVITPLNTIRSFDNSNSQSQRIQTVPISFPWREAGLPEGCESLDSLTSMELAGKFFQACEMLQGPLEELIGGMKQKPSCIVSTNAVPWTQKVSDKFNIPRYVFETVSCFTLMCSDHLSRGNVLETVVLSDCEPFLVPGIPHEIEFTKARLPKTLRKCSDGFEKFGNQIEQARESAKGTLVNSFMDLEPWYVERCKEERGKVWCIGPVSLSKKDLCNNFSVEGHYCCLKWLDKMKPNSVVYACFGSLCRISSSQMKQIALGLEASDFPFIWIIKDNDYSSEVENWLKQEKFKERVGERGLLVRGWVPQVQILSHPSVGGFLTHCGWNSTLEGISAGVPMITWPMFADQFYNEKFIVDVLGIGVGVGVERSIDYSNCEKVEDLVRWDQVKNAVEKVMDGESEGGVKRRRRANELAEMASCAVERGGSSYSDVEMFVQNVINQVQ